jgi:hypothetical protein
MCSLFSDAINDSDHVASYDWMIAHKERKLREKASWYDLRGYPVPFLAGSGESKENSQNIRCVTILANFTDGNSVIYLINLNISVKIILRLNTFHSLKLDIFLHFRRCLSALPLFVLCEYTVKVNCSLQFSNLSY